MKIAVITPILHLNGVKELIESKGEVWYSELGTKSQVRKLILEKNIDTLVCNPNRQNYIIDRELLEGTSVKLINTCSTGLNHIDTDYCRENKITILSLKTDFELLKQLPSTSELALTLMLSLLRNIPKSIQHVKEGGWDYQAFIGRMASQMTIGIIGYGRLGKMMAKFCNPLCKKILIYDPYVKSKQHTNCSLEELIETSDIISLHVHVKKDTKYMINKDLLAKSKKSPYIINTSRGEIVKEVDIVEALKHNIISGYGADVLEDEFEDIRNSPIVKAMNQGYNIIVTPHTGGMTQEGQQLAFTWAINKL